MKKSIILVLLVLINLETYSQAERLYKSDGVLLIDSSFSISSNAYQILKRSGRKPLSIVQRLVTYPQIDKENNIQGTVIASFQVTKKGEVINIKIEKTSDEYLSRSVYDAIYACRTSLGNYLKPKSEIEKFYVPIKFELEIYDFEKDINDNSTLTKKELVVPIIYDSVSKNEN